MKESGESRKRRTPEEIESSIQGYLEHLPAELRRVWAQKLDAAEDADLASLENELSGFIKRRESALHTRPHFASSVEHVVTDQDAINRTLDTIREIEGRNDLYVGEGKTAHVFRDPYAEGLCYKYVHDFDEYREWNSIEIEAHFLELLEGLEVDGARTPHLTGFVDQPDIKVIAMEYLQGRSIDKYVNAKRPFPSDFNPELFMRRLRDYITALHAKNIYHRDLHEGNVIIGPNSTPYIIDFGRATFSIVPESAYEVYDMTGTVRLAILMSDEERVSNLEARIRAHSR